ncbi:MAG: SDR family NAD(P)-dependent oxidoreductase [Chloroflexota bacterium]
MGDSLKDKVAVVTGAGRGIGRGIAIMLGEEGAKVVVNDLGVARDGTGAEKGPADEVVAEIKKKKGIAVVNYNNVATVEGGEGIVKAAVDNFGKIDILINVAGILRDRMIFNMSPEEWDGVIKTHLYGHYNCTRPASALMRQQRSGSIINFGSSTGLGNGGQANYAAAKEGIIGFTRTIARDLGRYGIYCNAIRPTAGTRMTISPEYEEGLQGRIRRGELTVAQAAAKRPPEPDFVAPFVVWLAINASKYNINGYDFAVRGGHVGLYSQPVEIRCIDKDFRKYGKWTLDELDAIAPTTICANLVNPNPPQPPAEKK